MPEMPEVEQVRKTLLPHIKGTTIQNIELNLARLIKSTSPDEFIAGSPGQTMLNVGLSIIHIRRCRRFPPDSCL